MSVIWTDDDPIFDLPNELRHEQKDEEPEEDE